MTVSFRKSESNNWKEFVSENPDLVATLKPDDVIMFVNTGFSQVYFMRPALVVNDGMTVLSSVKVRCLNGAFNTLMLQEYASAADIELIGISHFSECYSKYKA